MRSSISFRCSTPYPFYTLHHFNLDAQHHLDHLHRLELCVLHLLDALHPLDVYFAILHPLDALHLLNALHQGSLKM